MAYTQTYTAAPQMRQLHQQYPAQQQPMFQQQQPYGNTAPSQQVRSFSPPVLSEKHKKALKKNSTNIGLYAAAALFSLSCFFFLSDGDFSFFLTLAGLVRLFSFSLLLFKCKTTKNSSGVSIKTLQLYAGVFAARLSSILIHEGYLPFDSSGDWLYPSVEFASLLAVLGTMSVVSSTKGCTTDSFAAGLKLVPAKFSAAYVSVPCLVLALLVHPSLNESLFTDTTWTYALYMETLAVLPQLFMFQTLSKNGKPVEEWTSHFVAMLALARLLSLVFWTSTYHELAGDNESHMVGAFVLCAQLVHLLVMGDFGYYYVRALKNGTPLVLYANEMAV